LKYSVEKTRKRVQELKEKEEKIKAAVEEAIKTKKNVIIETHGPFDIGEGEVYEYLVATPKATIKYVRNYCY
jgi:hypothetical protein